MTLESTLSKKTYRGNGLTRHFPIPFFMAEARHLFLIIKDASGSRPITNNFNVNLEAKTVQYPLVGEPLSSSAELTIYRKVPLNQIVDLENAGAFHPKVLELDGFDRVVMQIQQLDEVLSRAVKVDITEEQTPSELLKAIFDAEAMAIAKAGEASVSADNAENSAGQALDSELLAKESENKALEYSDIAKNWAIGDITENEEGSAKNWAIGDITENEEGSAKYWAIQASEAVPDAMETVKGKAALATLAEVSAGIVDDKIVTPETFRTASLGYLSEHNNNASTHGPLMHAHKRDRNAHEDSYKPLDFCDIDFFNRQVPPPGYAMANGAVLTYADVLYPKLWAFLLKPENAWRLRGEAHWQASLHPDGIGGVNAFVINIAAKMIRLPDLRGDYMAGAGWKGKITGDKDWDATRRVTGTGGLVFHHNLAPPSGVMYPTPAAPTAFPSIYLEPSHSLSGLAFDNARLVPTDTRNHPATVYMLPCVYIGLPYSRA